MTKGTSDIIFYGDSADVLWGNADGFGEQWTLNKKGLKSSDPRMGSFLNRCVGKLSGYFSTTMKQSY